MKARRPIIVLLLATVVLAGGSNALAALITGLGDLSGGGVNSYATGVSADGSVVVGFSDAGGNNAFIWDSVNGMRNLYGVLTVNYGLDLTGWTLSEAQGVSGNGRYVVGYGTHNGNQEAFLVDLYNTLVAADPEPGMVGLGWWAG